MFSINIVLVKIIAKAHVAPARARLLVRLVVRLAVTALQVSGCQLTACLDTVSSTMDLCTEAVASSIDPDRIKVSQFVDSLI